MRWTTTRIAGEAHTSADMTGVTVAGVTWCWLAIHSAAGRDATRFRPTPTTSYPCRKAVIGASATGRDSASDITVRRLTGKGWEGGERLNAHCAVCAESFGVDGDGDGMPRQRTATCDRVAHPTLGLPAGQRGQKPPDPPPGAGEAGGGVEVLRRSAAKRMPRCAKNSAGFGEGGVPRTSQ